MRQRFHLLHIVSLLMLVMVMAGSSVLAQEQEATEESKTDVTSDHRIIEGVVKGIQDEYVVPDVRNLSKLYWAIGKMDIDNDKLIDYFLRINECQLYMQYFHNDFEWSNIRDATRDYILNNMDEFPTRIEMMVPIAVGRYDVEKEVFEIAEDHKIAGQRRIDFVVNLLEFKDFCSRHLDIYVEYPPNLIIILNRPLVMEQFPVKRELAQLYIEDQKRSYENLNTEMQMHKYERIAYLRLKVRITQYKNTVDVTGGEKRAVVFGRLEGYELYADEDKIKPLYTKDLKRKRHRRLKSHVGKVDEDFSDVVNQDVKIEEEVAEQ